MLDRNRSAVFLAFLLSICCAAPSGAQAVGDGPPQRPAIELAASEVWSVGSDELLIGEVYELIVDDDGTVFFLDAQLRAVQVVSADGTWLRSLGREGEGPGEFREPIDLFLFPDGRLGVVQQQPPKIALLSKDGLALDDHPLIASTTGYRVLMTGDAFDGGLVLVNMQFRAREDGNLGTAMVLTTVDDQGALIAELLQHDGGVDYTAMSANEEDLDNFVGYWTLTSDGRIAAVSNFDRYRIEVFATDGTPLHVIERAFTPRERTAAEKKAVGERFNMVVNSRKVEILPEPDARVLTGLVARPAGHLWARLDGGAVAPGREREALHFDEFDAGGGYVGTVVVRGAFGSVEDRVFVRGDRVYVVRGGADDGQTGEDVGEVTLTCYALR